MTNPRRVIVVGAGPVGLTAALVLVQRGIACIVVEKRAELSTASKASTFHPPTLEMLRAFGILDTVLERGQIADRIQYRRVDGEIFAEFDHALLSGDTDCPFRLHLEQSVVTPLLLEQLQLSGLAEIAFATEVLEVGSGATEAWIETDSSAQPLRRIEADYVLGADGARSAVRRSLGIGFEGADYPGKVLRLMVADDMNDFLPGVGQVSYIYDEDATSVSLLKMPDCWRIIIRIPDGLEPCVVQQPHWYMNVIARFIPAARGELKVFHSDVYGASRMVAERFCEGRVFLIGDSAHLTNTRGGMNMNCGIHDAYSLATAVAAASAGGELADVQAAAQRRRDIAVHQVIPRTDRNVSAGDDWLNHLRRTASDPAKAREYLLSSAMLDIAPARMSPAADPAWVAKG